MTVELYSLTCTLHQKRELNGIQPHNNNPLVKNTTRFMFLFNIKMVVIQEGNIKCSTQNHRPTMFALRNVLQSAFGRR